LESLRGSKKSRKGGGVSERERERAENQGGGGKKYILRCSKLRSGGHDEEGWGGEFPLPELSQNTLGRGRETNVKEQTTERGGKGKGI